MSDGTREDLFLCHLVIDGVDLGVWDKWDGADKDTASTKYRSGGSPDEESLGGPNTYSDLTLTRNYRLTRDAGIIGFLLKKCGNGSCVATKQPLDRSYAAYGDPTVAAGPLKTVTDPKVDANGSTPASIVLVIEVNSLTAPDTLS